MIQWSSLNSNPCLALNLVANKQTPLYSGIRFKRRAISADGVLGEFTFASRGFTVFA